ncbi:DUF2442 domain-containing protein [Candidatus Palauibacter sp.]|uniref:DUF2442 domain-containing protein n=1 Tax=Candidatus Palauibacter sp. TaxID=3101350 RepID=UPI003B01C930
MISVAEVKAREGYRIWIRFADGCAGEIDLSDLAGKGVFRAWDDQDLFDKAHLAPHGAVAWSAEIELCPDSLYLELTDKSPQQVFPGLGQPVPHA